MIIGKNQLFPSDSSPLDIKYADFFFFLDPLFFVASDRPSLLHSVSLPFCANVIHSPLNLYPPLTLP